MMGPMEMAIAAACVGRGLDPVATEKVWLYLRTRIIMSAAHFVVVLDEAIEATKEPQ